MGSIHSHVPEHVRSGTNLWTKRVARLPHLTFTMKWSTMTTWFPKIICNPFPIDCWMTNHLFHCWGDPSRRNGKCRSARYSESGLWRRGREAPCSRHRRTTVSKYDTIRFYSKFIWMWKNVWTFGTVGENDHLEHLLEHGRFVSILLQRHLVEIMIADGPVNRMPVLADESVIVKNARHRGRQKNVSQFIERTLG